MPQDCSRKQNRIYIHRDRYTCIRDDQECRGLALLALSAAFHTNAGVIFVVAAALYRNFNAKLVACPIMKRSENQQLLLLTMTYNH